MDREEEIRKIYKDVVINGVYDENYENDSEPTITDGKAHGICLHFSKQLLKKMQEQGFLATIVSVLADDKKHQHAAVLYQFIDENIPYTLRIADPVSDIRPMTEQNMNDDERSKLLDNDSSKSKISILDFIQQYGELRVFKPDMSNAYEVLSNPGLTDIEEIATALDVAYGKNRKQITTLTSIRRSF